MEPRQGTAGLGVLERNGERLEAEAKRSSRGWLRHSKAAERLLYDDLPNRGGAQVGLVLRTAERVSFRGTQPAVVGTPPEKDVGVDQ